MQQELTKLLEGERIRNVLRRYARGVDRRDWALVSSAYHPDGYDDHGGYKGDIPGLLEWLQRRHEVIEQSMHFLGNCMVDFLSETTAVVETYCIVYQRYGEEAHESIELWLGDQPLPAGKKLMAELACRYVDHFERRGEEWRIARRAVVMEEIKASVEPVRLRADFSLARRDHADELWKALPRDQ